MKRIVLFFLVVLVLSVAGCAGGGQGTGEPGPDGGVSLPTGGTTATGGTSATGGVTSTGGTIATGGASATGGIRGTGGTTASGGTIGSGGTSARGGTIGAGGSAGGDAGVPRDGGAATGGSTVATGGTTAAGGTSVTGGTTGTGGAPSTGGSSGTSPGCGSTNTTSACNKSGTKCTLNVGGTDRTFYVELPSGYNPSTPYRVIFQFHPLGGSAEGALTMYGLKSRIPDAIYVSPQGLASSGSTGWPNTNGQDVNFTKAMVEYVQTKFCVDRSRIFSTGFSYGGIMSLTVGCQMSDVFRAIAPESGQLFAPSCNLSHPVAVWQSEGDSDGTVTPTSAASARDYYVKANGCSSTTHAVNPSPCVTYDGCKSGYPVTWCLFRGGHEMPSFGPDAITAFFKQF